MTDNISYCDKKIKINDEFVTTPILTQQTSEPVDPFLLSWAKFFAKQFDTIVYNKLSKDFESTKTE